MLIDKLASVRRTARSCSGCWATKRLGITMPLCWNGQIGMTRQWRPEVCRASEHLFRESRGFELIGRGLTRLRRGLIVLEAAECPVFREPISG